MPVRQTAGNLRISLFRRRVDKRFFTIFTIFMRLQRNNDCDLKCDPLTWLRSEVACESDGIVLADVNIISGVIILPDALPA